MAFFKTKVSEPEAVPKEKGKSTIIDILHDHQQSITTMALKHVMKHVPAHIRQLYDGNAEWSYNTQLMLYTLEIQFKPLSGNSVKVWDYCSEEDLAIPTCRVGIADRIATECTAMLLADYDAKMREAVKHEVRKLSPPPLKKTPKKPVCKLCGPDDPRYPAWEGECPHKQVDRKKKRD